MEGGKIRLGLVTPEYALALPARPRKLNLNALTGVRAGSTT
jgi:hypothetical protein